MQYMHRNVNTKRLPPKKMIFIIILLIISAHACGSPEPPGDGQADLMVNIGGAAWANGANGCYVEAPDLLVKACLQNEGNAATEIQYLNYQNSAGVDPLAQGLLLYNEIGGDIVAYGLGGSQDNMMYQIVPQEIMLADVRGQYSLSPTVNNTAPSVSFVLTPRVLFGP